MSKKNRFLGRDKGHIYRTSHLFYLSYNSFSFRKATKDDICEIIDLINKAYSLDIGNTGLAFMKEGGRIRTAEQIEEF